MCRLKRMDTIRTVRTLHTAHTALTALTRRTTQVVSNRVKSILKNGCHRYYSVTSILHFYFLPNTKRLYSTEKSDALLLSRRIVIFSSFLNSALLDQLYDPVITT